MRLSIIIPYFNSEEWVGTLLDALLDQDLPQSDYEILVVDDGSTEEPQTVRRYVSQYPNVLYQRQANAGVSVARNAGMQRARGDWVFFCDSDDRVRPQALGKMIALAERHELDMLFWNFLRVGPEDMPVVLRSDFDAVSPVQTGYDYLVHPPADFSPSVSRYLVRRAFLERHALSFAEGIFYEEDSMFRLDVMAAAQRVAHVDVDFYFYVQRESSVLHASKRRSYDRYAPCMEAYLSKLTRMMDNPSVPQFVKPRLQQWRDIDTFYMLKYLFLYSPVSSTKTWYPRLQAIQALPLDVKGGKAIRLTRWCMNRPRLWTGLCRVFHILPASLRQQMK